MSDALVFEQALLGALTATGQGFARVAHLVEAADFIDANHVKLFRLIAACTAEARPHDAVTLAAAHPFLGELALTYANEATWSPRNMEYYAERIAASAHARRVRAAGASIARLPDEGIHETAWQLLTACAPCVMAAVVPLREAMRDVLVEQQTRMEARGLTGVATGLPELDDITGGLQPAELIIVAARPTVGKTAFATQVGIAAAKAGHRVLLFSLEMSARSIAGRALAHTAPANASGFRDPQRFTEADHRRVFDAQTTLAELPFDIVRGTSQTVEAVCATARQCHAITPLGLIAIDYLTLLTPPKANTTNDAVQLMTRALKRLAVELNVPVLLLCQLNRAAEGERKGPTLAHLRDSGAIEQDADVVMLMHRTPHGVVLQIAKHRNGECARLGLLADMAHMTFTPAPLDQVEPPEEMRIHHGFDGFTGSGG